MRILYATDGSQGALAGAQMLASLPLDQESGIRVLTVIGEDQPDEEGESALASAREALRDTAAEVDTQICRGAAAEQILHVASQSAADLIVVGRRGVSALTRFFIGSVAERVTRHAHCPVLVARPLRGTLDRVLLGVDGSACSQTAAAWLRRFPLPPACAIRLITLVTPPGAVSASRVTQVSYIHDHLVTLAEQEKQAAHLRLESMVSAFAAAGRKADSRVRPDDPAAGLLDAAEEQKTDLIVVGSHGLTGIDRFLMGSVSEKVLRHAHCSVLVVRV